MDDRETATLPADKDRRESTAFNDLDSPEKIRNRLRHSLKSLGPIPRCSVLGYPDYFNVGDHAIWLGMLHWLLTEHQCRIDYAASSSSFSNEALESQSPEGPIIFTGGGNFGDLWPGHQTFRENIIARYPHRPIIIMPQCVYFKDPAKLEQSRKIFNAHPALYLMTRDSESFNFAEKYFENCHSLLAPDIAFALANFIPCGSDRPSVSPSRTLYLLRCDREEFHAVQDKEKRAFIKKEDWCTMNPASRLWQKVVHRCPVLWRPPSEKQVLRWTPPLMKAGVEDLLGRIKGKAGEAMHRFSLFILLKGLHQLDAFDEIISDRLHAHILSVLLGKQNVLLPNSYYKNESFYKTWTSRIPYAAWSRIF